MSVDHLNQLATQLTALQNKIADKNSELNHLLSQEIQKISRIKALENPIIDLSNLYNVLNDHIYTSFYHRLKIRKHIEQLNIFVLNIVNEQLEDKLESTKKLKKTSSPIAKPRSKLFISIATLGTILAALSGAAAIQSIFSAFISVVSFPAGLIIGAQILFAAVAVFAFYFFELNTIGKSLGIRPLELGLLFKQYSQQEHSFKESFRLLNKQFQNCANLTEYQAIDHKFTRLKTMYTSFEHKLKEAEHARKPNIFKTIAQKILTILGAAVFGVLAALGAQPVLIAFLPVLLGAVATGPIGLAVTAIVMGVCALAGAGLFVFMERKGERIINKLWGTPTKTIDKLLSRSDKINGIINDIELSKSNTFKHLDAKLTSQLWEEAYYQLQNSSISSYNGQKNLPTSIPQKSIKSVEINVDDSRDLKPFNNIAVK